MSDIFYVQLIRKLTRGSRFRTLQITITNYLPCKLTELIKAGKDEQLHWEY